MNENTCEPVPKIEEGDSNPQKMPVDNTEEITGNIGNVFSTICDKDGDLHKSDWYIVGASAIGNAHAKGNKLCEDYHYCVNIENNWGVAVVSDGAGSAKNSHLGSAFICRKTAELFKDKILQHNWHNAKSLPADEEWEQKAVAVLQDVKIALKRFVENKNIEFKSVSCTLTVAIFSAIGILVTHVGDGRAAYCNEDNEWKSIITPHKGEEANETIFMTADDLFEINNLALSGVKIPECRVIREKPTAFTIMSDGCEKHSFFCSQFDTAINKWNDPNAPSVRFFHPLISHLRSLKNENFSLAEANKQWMNFLDQGMPSIKAEPDDKTMILGII